jgi:hypothetical protein
MARSENVREHAPAFDHRRFIDSAVAGPLGRLVSGLRSRLTPTVYVDGCDVPDLPESPYRARLTIPIEHAPEGVEVRERDVVRGRMKVVYEIRCACGRRWFNPQLERVQLCPRCGRAVLLQPPSG